MVISKEEGRKDRQDARKRRKEGVEEVIVREKWSTGVNQSEGSKSGK